MTKQGLKGGSVSGGAFSNICSALNTVVLKAKSESANLRRKQSKAGGQSAKNWFLQAHFDNSIGLRWELHCPTHYQSTSFQTHHQSTSLYWQNLANSWRWQSWSTLHSWIKCLTKNIIQWKNKDINIVDRDCFHVELWKLSARIDVLGSVTDYTKRVTLYTQFEEKYCQ